MFLNSWAVERYSFQYCLIVLWAFDLLKRNDSQKFIDYVRVQYCSFFIFESQFDFYCMFLIHEKRMTHLPGNRSAIVVLFVFGSLKKNQSDCILIGFDSLTKNWIMIVITLGII